MGESVGGFLLVRMCDEIDKCGHDDVFWVFWGDENILKVDTGDCCTALPTR